MPEDDDQIVCATYTHARRHPMVIGQIGGWRPPFQLSFSQVGVLVVVLFVEFRTWGLWLGHLPPSLGMFVAVVLPVGAAWATRRARIEGRSLPRAAMGWVSFALTPKAGRSGGRNHAAGRVRSCSAWVFVAPGGGPSSALPSGPRAAGVLSHPSPSPATVPLRGAER